MFRFKILFLWYYLFIWKTKTKKIIIPVIWEVEEDAEVLYNDEEEDTDDPFLASLPF